MKNVEFLETEVKISTLAELFASSAALNVDRTALIYNNRHITYAELNARSNKLCHYLLAKGIGPESLVPVCINSGIDMIIGLLAILKSGGACVPIDPDFPVERIKYILDDCKATVLLVHDRTRYVLDQLQEIEIISIDKDNNIINNCSEQSSARCDASNLAYVIYTSGTTGKPKGVMVEHRNIVNNLNWAQSFFKFDSTDLILQKTNFCFDVSIWEIFNPLIAGACLVIVDKDDFKDVGILKALIEYYRVTAVHFVPAVLERFMLNIKYGECGSLKHIVSSGESLSLMQARLVRQLFRECKFYNLYGPTETTIHSSYWIVPMQPDLIDKVFIGRGIHNTEFFIFDENKNLVPEGCTGELLIGGLGITRGYLNKPELTYEKFKYYNLGDRVLRLYSSGDLARLDKSGEIEYLGRIDDQVKVNGYRIELEEIEAVLAGSIMVKQGVVIVKTASSGTKQIVAFVVLNQNYNTEQVWVYLRKMLPGYMLPVTITHIESIPVNQNGKIDKKALLLDVDTKIPKPKFTQPETELEKQIFSIWASVLNIQNFGTGHNFFELGGNSLLAAQVLSLLKKQTSTNVSFLMLYQYPTIKSFARVIGCGYLFKPPGALVAIKPTGSKPPVYLVNGEGYLAQGFVKLNELLGDEQPAFGFQTDGRDKNGKLFETLEELAAHFVHAILANDNDGPYNIAGYSLGGTIAYEMAQQLQSMGREVKNLIMIDSVARDPNLTATKYTLPVILKFIGLNLFMLKYGLSKAFKYSQSLINTIIKKYKKRHTIKVNKDSYISGSNIVTDIFEFELSLGRKYRLVPYNGKITVLRAREITFYMDNYKHLGWKDYANEVICLTTDGTHFTMFDDNNINNFANIFQQVLNDNQ